MIRVHLFLAVLVGIGISGAAEASFEAKCHAQGGAYSLEGGRDLCTCLSTGRVIEPFTEGCNEPSEEKIVQCEIDFISSANLPIQSQTIPASLANTGCSASDFNVEKNQDPFGVALHPPVLEEEIEQSDLKSYLPLIMRNSKGVMDAYEYISYLRNHPSQEGYLLGISDYRDIYDAFAEMTKNNMLSWKYGYQRFKLNYQTMPDHTDRYMKAITKTGKSIAFIVPRKLLTHNPKAVTAGEMRWLFDHPKNMKNVIFVFGAYDMISSREYCKIEIQFRNNDDDERIKFVTGILKNYKKPKATSTERPHSSDTLH